MADTAVLIELAGAIEDALCKALQADSDHEAVLLCIASSIGFILANKQTCFDTINSNLSLAQVAMAAAAIEVFNDQNADKIGEVQGNA